MIFQVMANTKAKSRIVMVGNGEQEVTSHVSNKCCPQDQYQMPPKAANDLLIRNVILVELRICMKLLSQVLKTQSNREVCLYQTLSEGLF